jgi:uncharacterized protein YbjQ (UPF0145 family)
MALGLALPLAASPAVAGEQERIEVTSQSEMKRWQKQATRKLDNALRQIPGRRSAAPANGIVQIAFRMGENGRPEQLIVHSNSADRTAVRMAKYAVRRLGDLSDVPVGNAQEKRFLANIIFAADRIQHEEFKLALATQERARLAAGEAESETIVLGG